MWTGMGTKRDSMAGAKEASSKTMEDWSNTTWGTSVWSQDNGKFRPQCCLRWSTCIATCIWKGFFYTICHFTELPDHQIWSDLWWTQFVPKIWDIKLKDAITNGKLPLFSTLIIVTFLTLCCHTKILSSQLEVILNGPFHSFNIFSTSIHQKRGIRGKHEING